MTTGTTFSIFRRSEGEKDSDPLQWVLQPGSRQVAAGYVVYGSSTVLVYSAGNGVHGFTLDPSVEPAFSLTKTSGFPDRDNTIRSMKRTATGSRELICGI